MSHPALRIAAARHFLGLARPAEIIDAAHAALDDGIYSYNLGEVATYREPVWFDLDTLFKRTLQELGIVVTNWEDAIQTWTEAHILPLAEGATMPEAAVGRIRSDYAELVDLDLIPQARASLDPLARFVDLHSRYELSREYEAFTTIAPSAPTYQQEREQLDAECVNLAREWCWNRWQSSIDPAWLTSTVTALARGIADERAFDRLPILADALQDAGCDHPDILDHCRSPGPHVRGCWVVDLLLGRPWREPA